MKTNPGKYLLVLLISGGFLWACTKKADGITGPAGPQGPAGANSGYKASAITGYVDLYDQYANALPSAPGITVSTFRGDTLVTSTTDSTGKFALPALPPGNYDLLFKKAGCDSLKTHVVHSGGDEDKFIGIVQMWQSQTTKITGEDFTYLQSVFAHPGVFDVISFNVYFDGPAQNSGTQRNFSFYFSKSPDVSTDNYSESNIFNSTVTSTNQYNLQYFASSGVNFNKGDTVYVKTYILPDQNNPMSWFDYTTYRSIPYPYKGDSILKYIIWPD